MTQYTTIWSACKYQKIRFQLIRSQFWAVLTSNLKSRIFHAYCYRLIVSIITLNCMHETRKICRQIWTNMLHDFKVFPERNKEASFRKMWKITKWHFSQIFFLGKGDFTGEGTRYVKTNWTCYKELSFTFLKMQI